MTLRRLSTGLAMLLAVALTTASCDYLRDAEPWTATVQYRIGDDGVLIVEPLVINADSNNGLITVVNETAVRRGFSVPDLAVFEEIPSDFTLQVRVDEAQDGETYLWRDQLHKDDFEGQLVVEYVEEEFRNR